MVTNSIEKVNSFRNTDENFFQYECHEVVCRLPICIMVEDTGGRQRLSIIFIYAIFNLQLLSGYGPEFSFGGKHLETK